MFKLFYKQNIYNFYEQIFFASKFRISVQEGIQTEYQTEIIKCKSQNK